MSEILKKQWSVPRLLPLQLNWPPAFWRNVDQIHYSNLVHLIKVSVFIFLKCFLSTTPLFMSTDMSIISHLWMENMEGNVCLFQHQMHNVCIKRKQRKKKANLKRANIHGKIESIILQLRAELNTGHMSLIELRLRACQTAKSQITTFVTPNKYCRC